MTVKELDAYELMEQRYIDDVKSEGYILRHKKSGARVAVLSNDDDNKVFYIGFRTPPEDETGVPHIIEHTVLCGSDKFPLKDPFVELIKGSLNTFLNAMTYPDKTVYPVASYNAQDFHNLMEVYLDAVFHPNITKYREIFMQEGWHYELEDADSPITVNGVVYNEMKGAYSSPEEVLQTQIFKSLFPDNTYSRDSGGNPKFIPTLTYEEYLAFYKKYYHPSNSYIYLYGDMDVAERLDYMDKAYLCAYDRCDIDSEIKKQEAFSENRYVKAQYPIASEEPEEKQTFLSYNKVVSDAPDKELYQAFEVLEYALITAPGAPLEKALLQAGIGEDVYGSFWSGYLQNIFSVTAKNTDYSKQEQFVSIIEETLQKLVREGLDKKALLAGINSMEFRFREADFGSYPKGLLYGLQCLDSWLFDDEKPFLHLECLDTFAFLKKQIDTGYFEGLIEKYLLGNPHGSVVAIVPKKGMIQQEEAELEQKLQEYKQSLSDEEIKELIAQTARLKEYQEEPASEEDMKKIPMLTREDMRKEANPLSNIENEIEGVPVVRHEIQTNGIDYVTLMFEAGDFEPSELPMLGFLRSVLGYVDTKSYSYTQLANEINIYTGGIQTGLSFYPRADEQSSVLVKFEVRMKALGENRKKGFALIREILETSKLDDTKRLAELIGQSKSRLQQAFSGSGHTVASIRALSGVSEYNWYQDAVHGIRYYQEILDMERRIVEDADSLVEDLKRLTKKIFARNRLLISLTSEEAEYRKALPVLNGFICALPESSPVGERKKPVCEKKKEGFCDASQIQYVARAGNFRRHGFAYSGYLRILRMILGYDYLWNNIRVKGGAYGCMNAYSRSGDTYFVSYRDPNLSKTNDVFEGIPEYLKDFDPNERDMTKYIIGTFGSIDTPLYPEAKGTRSMTAYLQNISYEDIQRERDEILHAQPKDIRGLSDLVQAVLEDDLFCVVGNENTIRENEKLFDAVQGLYEKTLGQ